NDERVIGDRSGIKAVGVGSKFTLTVPAATTERTLRVYIGGWNSKGIVTATLPGATTYTASKSSSGTYTLVLTLKYSSAVPATLRVEYREAWDGSGNGSGSIKLQAAALSGAAAATTGSALLTWNAPTTYTDGTTLTDLAGFRVYWGNVQGSFPNYYQINNGGTSSYTVKGLPAGRWYFKVTALTAAGQESSPTPVLSKLIQ
ncbi:MAG TPA: fibronectin type III domain-containing protein, partial [Gammaproteobacteria bacterium]|nr:fibronectin type III domain-containing protein [Gammaproteobacteria bacterium]